MTARTILVTGSANGMGAATLELLSRQGHRAIGLDLADAEICADLSDPEARAAAISEASHCSDGMLDAVIACAGVAGAEVNYTISVNYFGVTKLFEGLRPLLARSPAPRAVAISSSAIILGHDEGLVEACLSGDEARARATIPADPLSAYASSKVALSRWIRRTAILTEWAGSGILLNAIAPGLVITNMTRPILATAEGRATLAEATPIAVDDHALPGDIAPLLTFLAGSECRYLVGQTIMIDGGKDCIRRGDQLH